MSDSWLAIGTAAWLGILTSISPCPLASNIAAVSFVGRHVRNPRLAVVSGIAYALGRALTYVLVAMLVVSSIGAVPQVSLFLQKRMNQFLGPALVLIGLGMLGWLRLPFALPGGGTPAVARRKHIGVLGAGLLGVVFALSFCPVSAGLFFGALIPLAIHNGSSTLLPGVYGIGTGLPVVAFAVLIAIGAHGVARVFHTLASIERVARRVTGVIFVLCGTYLMLTHVLGLSLGF